MQYEEMLKELAVGEIYTEKQISNLLCNNRKDLKASKTGVFSLLYRNYTLIDKMDI
ncbi:hypothetical protein [Bacillus cereus]|uniref:hypothetical protein n=1 Tax=Bacillus cereus TaxID=1396 RepID=UPI0015D49905|nr:hypothetical protein [Bacillus cereus]